MSRGFTLIEVLITAAIVATLAAMALPLSELAIQRAKETELRRALRDIRDALDAYKRAADEGRVVRTADESGYPRTLDDLVIGVPDAKSATGARIYFLRRIPHDPFQAQATSSAWGLRSYESPPSEPRPGKDVYDVYSLSDRVGLNSVPYRKW
jgi:general secretion pathway protein G